MKQLSKKEIERKTKLVKNLNTAHKALEDAIDQFNAKMRELFVDGIQEKLDCFNEAITEAESFRDDIAREQTEYKDGRSEKWLESDTGQEYEAWSSAWETENFEEEEIDTPEELIVPDNPADTLDNLQNEPA